MSGVNKVFLIGRLGGDPELKSTQNGKNVATFSLATSEKYNGAEKTEWHKIIAWEKLSEVAKNYLTKGRMVHVEGKIQTREYESQGVKRSVTEIIATNITLLDSSGIKNTAQQNVSEVSEAKHENESYEDIPF